MNEVVSRTADASIEIQGSNDPQFDHLRESFTRHFSEHDELGASLAVTLGGKVAVDLWGGWKDKARTQPWTRETLAPLWSGTKAITGICFAMLIDRGLCAYNDRVSQYWPAFGVQGKDAVTIGQLLSHQAGLTGFILPTTLEELCATEFAAARLASQPPFWTPGTACGYHGVSLGPLTVVLFKRIEGRSVRQFVADEIAGPFDLALSIGLDPDKFDQAAEAVMADGDVDVGAFFKGRGAVSPTKPPADFRPAQAAALNPPMDGRYANLPEWRAAENPGANGFGNARALAEFYALVLGHPKNGKRLGTPEVIAQARRARIEGVDQVKNSQARWAAGFAVNEGLYGPNPDTFYHAGWGGTFTLGDPVADLTISYTPNRMGDLYEREPRRRGLVDAVYECLAT